MDIVDVHEGRVRMKDKEKSYRISIQLCSLLGLLMVGRIFGLEISQFFSAYFPTNIAPMIAGASILLYGLFYLLGKQLFSLMEKRRWPVWPLIVTMVAAYSWTMIQF
jgi:4-amino-4-deoxy-L-arabinose transferase-like glycosyltransferase